MNNTLYTQNTKKLSDEEFSELFVKYKENGDSSARNKLVMSFSYIAESLAVQLRGLSSGYAQVEDMISQGILTLIDCIERFDPEKGIRFEAYAYMRVRGGIIDLIRKQDWVPRRVRQTAKEINAANSELSHKLMREPTQEELAEEMGISVKKLSQYNCEISNASVLSFEELIQNVSQMGDVFEQSSGDDEMPERRLMRSEMRDVLANAIENLTERERLVVTLYFYEGLNLSEIAEVLEVSVQRVSQINAKSVSKLRTFMEEYLY